MNPYVSRAAVPRRACGTSLLSSPATLGDVGHRRIASRSGEKRDACRFMFRSMFLLGKIQHLSFPKRCVDAAAKGFLHMFSRCLLGFRALV